MDSKMGEDATKALERFAGLEIKVTIEVFTGRKPKADPPNTHQSKTASAKVVDFNGKEDH
jgi:hypothetical protein